MSKNKTTNIAKSKNTNIDSSREKQNLSKRLNILTEVAGMMMRRIAKSHTFSEVFASSTVSPQVTFGAGQTVFNKEGRGLVRVMTTLGREQDGDGALVWRLEIPEGFSCNPWGAIEQVALGCAAIAHNQAKGLSASEQKKLKENGHVQFQTYGVKRGKLRFALNALNFEPGITFEGRGCATVNPTGCAHVNVDYLSTKASRFADLVGLNVSNVATTTEKSGEGTANSKNLNLTASFESQEDLDAVLALLGVDSKSKAKLPLGKLLADLARASEEVAPLAVVNG